MTVEDRKPFEPKGDVPEWRLIYDKLMSRAEYGETITYEQLDDVLGRPFMKNRTPIYRATKQLEMERNRHLVAVPNIGYRVIEAREHIAVATSRRARAGRQIRRGVEVLQATEISRLTPAELDAYDRQTRINTALFSAIVHVDQRLTRVEEILRADGKM